MGDWTYYITFLKMSDIARRISIAEKIHTNRTLQDLLQRRLTDRSKGISSYLLNQSQRFFNALVVATYGGHPTWNELAVDEGPEGLVEQPPDELDGVLGFLRFDGSELLFAVDGQHRVEGIKQAIEARPELETKKSVSFWFLV
jgi:DNA sulfur modification protein DndB